MTLDDIIKEWRKRAAEIDDGSGTTLCAELAQHYCNRIKELEPCVLREREWLKKLEGLRERMQFGGSIYADELSALLKEKEST